MEFLKKNKKIFRGLLVIFFFVLVWFGVRVQLKSLGSQKSQVGSRKIVSQNIIDKCKEEEEIIKKVQSDPECLERKEFRCVDGWKVDWYYDKTLVSTTEFPNTFPSDASEELKNATIAELETSSCNCLTPISYSVLKNNKLEKTTCEKFYEFIENYNTSCGDCVLKWHFECC